jgi:hypothetical protein
MAAIAWFCQLVRYPALRATSPDDLPAAARRHARRITPLVVPLMLIELAASLGIAATRPAAVRRREADVSTALLLGIWLSTLAIQARQHARLQERHDPALLRSLVRWNAPRTAAWTLRAILAARMLDAHRRTQGGPNTALSP